MLILTLRTDKPDAELSLRDNVTLVQEYTWLAHRSLAETLLIKIEELLTANHVSWQDVGGIVVFQGPGSFTGLRIGITVANTMAGALSVPIVASSGEDWLDSGVERLLAGQTDQIALPEYGAPVHITPQKK